MPVPDVAGSVTKRRAVSPNGGPAQQRATSSRIIAALRVPTTVGRVKNSSWPGRVFASAGALALAALGLVSSAPPAAATTNPLTLSLSATSAADGFSFSGLIAGVVSPATNGLSPGATASPFQFTIACGSQTPCSSGTTINWDFGDGTIATTSSLSTSHDYSKVGEFTVTATVSAPSSSTSSYLGTASMRVLVSPRYGDVPVADPSGSPAVSAPSDAEAIWASEALGLFTPCGLNLPAVTGVSPSSVLAGEGDFCPGPVSSYGPQAPTSTSPVAPGSWLPAAPMAAGAAPDGSSDGPVNGITGAACLAAAANCNLPLDLFVKANGGNSDGVCNPSQDNSGATSSTTSCEQSVEKALQAAGILATSGALLVSPTNCGTGYGLVDEGTFWQAQPGVDQGCLSRAELFRAAVVALDGQGAGRTTASMPTGCSGTTGYYFARAVELGLPDTTETNASGATSCDAQGPVSKSAAYQVLAAAAALPTPAACPAGLSDMTGAPPNDCAVLAAGGPLVGDTSCPTGTGTCYNPTQALTRADAAELLATELLGVPVDTASLSLSLTGNHAPQPVNSPLEITATATLPSWYASSSTVTLTWPTIAAGAGTLSCPTSGPQPVNSAYQVVETCTYTQVHAGQTSLAVSASDSEGDAANATFALSVFNRSPNVGTALASASAPTITSTGGSSASAAVIVDDPFHQSLSYSLCPDGSPSSTCGRSTAVTYVSGAGSSSQGTASISSSTDPSVTGPGSVQVTFTPTGSLVDGVYSVVLKACNPDECAKGTVYGNIIPVTTASPQSVSASSRNSTVDITLSGTSPSDDPITSYEVTALPSSGTLSVDTSTSSTPSYVPAAVGITTTDPVVEYTPAPNGTVSSASFAFSTAGKLEPTTFSSPATVTIALP